jgi:hypothetical protein
VCMRSYAFVYVEDIGHWRQPFDHFQEEIPQHSLILGCYLGRAYTSGVLFSSRAFTGTLSIPHSSLILSEHIPCILQAPIWWVSSHVSSFDASSLLNSCFTVRVWISLRSTYLFLMFPAELLGSS